MIKGKVLTILAALLGVTAACSLGVAAYIIIQPGTSPENRVAETEAQLAGVEVVDNNGEHVDNDALPDISIDDGAVWTDSEVSNPEPEPESVISEPEPEPEPESTYQNPGTHGGYLHEVGGARFYTEHDINQWLRQDPDNPDYTDFDIEQMLIDLWCQDGGGLIENNVGYSFTNGEEWTKGIWFEDSDTDHENAFHMVTILYSINGEEYTTPIRIYEYPWPFLNHCKDYYFVLDQYYKYIHKDMAPLILLAIERMEANPHDGVLNDLNLNENFYCD